MACCGKDPWRMKYKLIIIPTQPSWIPHQIAGNNVCNVLCIFVLFLLDS
jgi:hypothetical protein